MRINRNAVLVGRRSVLVPYRKQHVPRYHEWMKDPLIQEQTASEPLSLEQEYEMQQSWAVDEDKLTFIILARPDTGSNGNEDKDTIDLLPNCTMVGDVNIFLNARHEYDDEDEEQARKDSSSQPADIYDAECEIMIAEHGYRRKGIAREALKMMFEYVTAAPTPTAESGKMPQVDKPSSHCSLPIPPEWLTCKISLTNQASIRLFESLGFPRQSVSEVWQEVEMRLTDNSRALPRQDGGTSSTSSSSILQVLFWQDE
ncbi:hypothetical protein PaG_01675 [Moesziomyces aphidis]|uniref:N-acetyltransferase domain-containing protein n=1 Tax=Moesziomyces aphidis TaxID=84754 RepID=W3VPB8_MOEAP|nr:hypothetical protein PaG_01675 [Moesziomyces aphidis]